ncbi:MULTISPECIES: BolA family protein [Niveibacterium]|uniref:BolA/IbaG family iron-sulfur metabolism protein n=1 Tax=Niveibacterium microcysteis TaxID=2811415 RepID=A0ABX7M8K4_9RHOO|nr:MULTISPECIES: BolA/IbaG family iron-sulfur metabolism protein [Niveibacterium]QSI77921.1 BolA/IbaG family iron-sulfur metabolism protein [Niveibacterium microcysteis]
MFQAEEIERLVSQGLPCDFIQIQGDDGVHFTGIVVSAEFAGKPRVRQHQAVYATLGPLMGNEIHALQLTTYTPEQWAAFRKELGE